MYSTGGQLPIKKCEWNYNKCRVRVTNHDFNLSISSLLSVQRTLFRTKCFFHKIEQDFVNEKKKIQHKLFEQCLCETILIFLRLCGNTFEQKQFCPYNLQNFVIQLLWEVEWFWDKWSFTELTSHNLHRTTGCQY